MVILASTLSTASPAWGRGNFNNILGEGITMAGPVQVSRDRQQVEADAKECATSLKSFLETGDAAKYIRFNEIFRKYYGFSTSKDATEPEKQKGSMFRDAFFSTQPYGYAAQLREGRSAALDAAFRSSHPDGFLPNQLADAAYEIYSKCAKDERVPEALDKKYGDKFVRAARETYYAAHPDKIAMAPPSEVVPVRVPPLPQNVTDSTIDVFLGQFGMQDQLSAASRDEKYRGLVATVMVPFNLKSLRDAGDLAGGLMQAYQRIGSDDRESFLYWLSGMDQKERAGLGASVVSIATAKGTQIPNQEVKKRFDDWKSAHVGVQQKIYALEGRLKAYPKSIRDTTLAQMTDAFEQKPGDYTLEQMEIRMVYLQKKREVLLLKRAEGKSELSSVDKELSAMQAWLHGLDVDKKTPEEGLSAMRGGFTALQHAYYTIDQNNLRLADILDSTKSNDKLFLLLTKYVFEMDRHALGMLKDTSPGDRNFTSVIRSAAGSPDFAKDANAGRQMWQADYYALLSPATGTALPTPGQAAIYTGAATLSTAAAVAFNDYVKTLKQNGLDTGTVRSQVATGRYLDSSGNPVTLGAGQKVNSSGQIVDSSGTPIGSQLTLHPETQAATLDPTGTRTLVANAVAALNAVHPALAVEYFNAIRHVAEICEQDQSSFHNALSEITLSIDAETSVLTSRSSPVNQLPTNIRKTMERLDRALGEVAEISKGTIAQFDRFNLLDRQLFIDQTPPNLIHQRTPNWAPRLFETQSQVGGLFTPSPFGNFIYTPVPGGLYTSGGVYTSQPNYGGGLTLPTMRPLQVNTSVTVVQGALFSYLWPQQVVLSISYQLPGVLIPRMSPTKLLIEIRRAFVQTDRPQYASLRDAISGGMALGLTGTKSSDDWVIGGGGLGTLLTPTGGAAIGGTKDLTGTYGGMSWLAVPIGTVKGKEVSLDTSMTGVEKDTDNSWKILQRAITTQWDPKNPSQTLVVVNSDATANGQWYTTARTVLVEKDGTIYDLKGGQDDLVPMLNFMAGFVNKAFATPSTVAFDYEPTVKRGGGALVFDLGKTPLLFEAQSIPFLEPAGTPQPLLVQWTLAGAHTTETTGEKTDIQALAFPGQLLQIKPGADASNPGNYTMQGVDYMFRRVKKDRAWELSMGGDYASTPVGTEGGAGFFLKTQQPGSRLGGGISYEASATNLEALALLQQSQEAVDYVNSIHRIATTLYGSKQISTNWEAGSLLYVVSQLQSQPGHSLSYDTTFYRAVGLLKGLHSAARFDFSRMSGMDEMLAAYDSMAAKVGNDPTQAASQIAAFQNQYTPAYLQQVLDKYYLGVQVNKDFSIEGLVVAQEENNKFSSQVPDTVYARSLWTWKVGERTGFFRAFASMPVMVAGGVNLQSSTTQVGLVGAGTGFDVFDSVFLQRIAADAGMIVSRIETDTTSNQIEKWGIDASKSEGGFFVQGAASVYSGLAEDSRSYRRLTENLEKYKALIRVGVFSQIPEEAREAMCRDLDPAAFKPTEIKDIRDGRDFKPSPAQTGDLEDGLWRNWFSERKTNLQDEFTGKMRVLLGASRYEYFGGPTYWDIGTFVEYVDGLKLYAIAAKREELGVFTGMEYKKDSLRIALGGGATRTSIGGSASVGYTFMKGGMPMEVGVSGYGTSANLPEYAAPIYTTVPRTFTPQFGVMFYYTIGAQGPPTFMQAAPGTTFGGPAGQYH
jgi:hypothetical protein